MKLLTEKAVLVHFTCNSLGTTRVDTGITKEVEDAHTANNPGKYYKSLFTRENVKDIWQLVNKSRRLFFRYSLPWLDGGTRIMPITLLEKFLKENAEIMKEYSRAVSRFIENYDDIMEINKKRLNDMFKREEYPTKEETKMAFSIRIGYMPLPNRDDFRISAPDEIVNQVKNEYEQGLKESESLAKSEIVERLEESIRRLIEKLSAQDKTIRETAFSRVGSMVSNLRALNITDDSQIESLLKETEGRFTSLSADTINKNNILRSQKATEGKVILEKVVELKRNLIF